MNLIVIGDEVILCPSVSLHSVPDVLPLTNGVKRCPTGTELMNGATILTAYFGGGPYILRRPGKPVTLGRGSYMAILEVIGKKYGFKTVLTPARSVVSYIGNVRSTFQNLLPYQLFFSALRSQEEMLKLELHPLSLTQTLPNK